MSLIGLGMAAARGSGPNDSWKDIYQRELGSDQAPSLYRGTAPVSGFLDLISRPGWALRSLMAGDVAAAGKHIAMLANDLAPLPFGWIDRKFSFMGLIAPDDWRYPGSYDITTQKEKYEFTDVLEQWGWQGLPHKGSWGRFGIDVVGGVIDPLSLVGTPVGGLARSALKNTTTSLGRGILKGALTTGRTGKSQLLTQFGDGLTDMDDILVHALTKSQNLSDEAVEALKNRSAWSRAAEEAAENVPFGDPRKGGGELVERLIGGSMVRHPEGLQKGAYFWQSLSGPEMKSARRWLINEGHIDAPGGIAIGLPFNIGPQKIYHPVDYLRQTQTFGGVFKTGLAQDMGELASTVGSIWQRTGGALVPWIRGMKHGHAASPGVSDLARTLRGQIHSFDSQTRDDLVKSFGNDPEIVEMFRKKGTDLETFYDKLFPPQRIAMDSMENLPTLKRGSDELKDALDFKDKPSERLRRGIVPFLVSKASKSHQEAVSIANKMKLDTLAAFRRGEDFIVKKTGAVGDKDMLFKTPFRVVEESVREGAKRGPTISLRDLSPDIDDDVMLQLRDMVGRPLNQNEWTFAKRLLNEDLGVDEFAQYSRAFIEQELPRQFLAKNISTQLGPEGLSNWHPDVAQALNPDLLTKAQTSIAREMDYEELYHVLNAARNHSLNSMTDGKLGRRVSDIKPLQQGEYQFSVPEVAHRRLLKDNRERAFQEAENHIEKIARAKDSDVDSETLGKYFNEMMGEVIFERGVLTKLLAGGTFTRRLVGEKGPIRKEIDLTPTPFGEVPSPTQYRVNASGGIEETWRWVGVNEFYKPLLTSHPANPAYHIGNTVGSVFMMASDDRIGWSGVGAVLGMLGGKLGIARSPKIMKAYAKALHTDPRRSLIGMDELRKGLDGLINPMEKVGTTGMTHVEFIEAARNFLGGGMSLDQADLMRNFGETMNVIGKAPKEFFLNRYNPFVNRWSREIGQNMANYVENHLRLHGFKRLIEKGVPAELAGPKIQKLLVDYTVQSKWDQTLRDIFPFIRFRLGSIAWTRAVLTKPRTLMLPAVTQRAADQHEVPQDPSKPPMDSLGIGIPGYKIPTRAGAETTLQNLGMFGLEGSGRRGLMGDLHPLLEAGLEQTLDREIWSGKRFASDTRARGIERMFANEGVSRWGTQRPEIDGLVKKIFDSAPFARQKKTIDKVVENYLADKGLFKSLRDVIGVKERQRSALQEMRTRIEILIEMEQKKGNIYTFTKSLSARPSEQTSPALAAILKQYEISLKAIRDVNARESRGQR